MIRKLVTQSGLVSKTFMDPARHEANRDREGGMFLLRYMVEILSLTNELTKKNIKLEMASVQTRGPAPLYNSPLCQILWKQAKSSGLSASISSSFAVSKDSGAVSVLECTLRNFFDFSAFFGC